MDLIHAVLHLVRLPPILIRRPTTVVSSVTQAALRQQQQRLLLLRHASKCPAEGEQCKVTPHCQAMKRLWKHIAECKNQQCPVSFSFFFFPVCVLFECWQGLCWW